MMTREYVIKMLEARLDCMRRSSSGIDEDCTSEKCDDCDLNYAQGAIGEQQEALKEVISALQVQELSELKNNMDKKEILDGLYEIKNWKCGGDAKMHAVIEAAIKALEVQFEVPSAEPLTDTEQRIFLNAISREEEVCRKVDAEWGEGDEECEINLVHVCHEIVRKVKGALWT